LLAKGGDATAVEERPTDGALAAAVEAAEDTDVDGADEGAVLAGDEAAKLQEGPVCRVAVPPAASEVTGTTRSRKPLSPMSLFCCSGDVGTVRLCKAAVGDTSGSRASRLVAGSVRTAIVCTGELGAVTACGMVLWTTTEYERDTGWVIKRLELMHDFPEGNAPVDRTDGAVADGLEVVLPDAADACPPTPGICHLSRGTKPDPSVLERRRTAIGESTGRLRADKHGESQTLPLGPFDNVNVNLWDDAAGDMGGLRRTTAIWQCQPGGSAPLGWSLGRGVSTHAAN